MAPSPSGLADTPGHGIRPRRRGTRDPTRGTRRRVYTKVRKSRQPNACMYVCTGRKGRYFVCQRQGARFKAGQYSKYLPWEEKNKKEFAFEFFTFSAARGFVSPVSRPRRRLRLFYADVHRNASRRAFPRYSFLLLPQPPPLFLRFLFLSLFLPFLSYISVYILHSPQHTHSLLSCSRTDFPSVIVHSFPALF